MKVSGSSLKPSAQSEKAAAKDLKAELKTDPQAEKVAQEFEALFLDLMLKSMRRTASPETESNAEGIYKSMLDTEYAKNMAASQSFGIKELILDWMQKQHPAAISKQEGIAAAQGLGAAKASNSALNKAENISLQEMHSRMAMEIYKMQSNAGMK